MSGARWSDLIREALAMRRNQELSWAQTLMAANTPMLLHASMVRGDLRSGVMAGGQVAGLIDDLPSCRELIERIVREAEDVLARLGSRA
jgi:NAD(P)H-dependent flavin oxidoreductase YrpB (nitropropane dioxygenase family)